MVGSSVERPTRLDGFPIPAATIYLADNEDGWWRPIVETQSSAEIERFDVYLPSHLPASGIPAVNAAKDTSVYTSGRRIALQRHRKGMQRAVSGRHEVPDLEPGHAGG